MEQDRSEVHGSEFMRLEDLTKGATVKGILPDQVITVIDTQWHGLDVVTKLLRS